MTGEVSAIRENGATSGAGVLATFGYDDLGRRSLTRGNGTVTSYGYDAVSRLASLGHDLTGTSHDVSFAFTHDPATGSASLTHDARGNITAVGSAGYGYDVENRMTAGGLFGAIKYDPLGRLQEVTYTAPRGFLWDGHDLVLEYVDGGQVQRRYVHGPGMDEPLVWYGGSGTSDRRWLHADERGSIIGVSTGTGSSLSVNRYDEYGVPAPGNGGRFGYTGQVWLAELGAYYYKARIYNPTLGRFMQTDPIGYGDGLNLYGYVKGDPVNRVDPFGNACWTVEVSGDDVPGSSSMSGGGWTCLDGYELEMWFMRQNEQWAWDFLDMFDGGAGRDFEEKIDDLLNVGKGLICALPAVNIGYGADLYAGLGGSIGGGYNIDLANGTFGVSGSAAVGLGVGVAMGPNIAAGPSGGGIVTANVAAGGGFALPIAPGVNVGGAGNYNIIGTDPGFSGATIGRFGTPLGYVNAGGNFGFNTPPLYDLGC